MQGFGPLAICRVSSSNHVLKSKSVLKTLVFPCGTFKMREVSLKSGWRLNSCLEIESTCEQICQQCKTIRWIILRTSWRIIQRNMKDYFPFSQKTYHGLSFVHECEEKKLNIKELSKNLQSSLAKFLFKYS
jgi:hypothetical protein